MKCFLFFLLLSIAFAEDMPKPFYRELVLTSPMMSGNDITIAQSLLLRDEGTDKTFHVDGVYGSQSELQVKNFQLNYNLASTGVLDSATAKLLLDLHSEDNYKDSGFTASSMGYIYKLHIPVHANRSVETYGTLFDKDNNIMLKFKVRSHGYRSDGTSASWPDFGVNDIGLNEFTSNGNSVTGLIEVDLNSPEPYPQTYGPWPINRMVRGLDGNAAILLPNIRDGILLHTGNWTTSSKTWTPLEDMPNSSGCFHSHPSEVETMYKILSEKLGVVINPNTFSGKNYPYKPQGIAVIERVD